jgi:hypothetical protein
VNVLALLCEDTGFQALQYHTVGSLNLPISSRVGHRGPIYSDVMIITEVQELLSGELSAIISNDRIRYPEMEDDILDETHHLLRADLGQRPCLDPFSKVNYCNDKVGQAPGCFSKGPQKIQTPYHKWPSNGYRLELLGRGMNLLGEVLAPHARPHYLCCITGSGRPVESLLEGLTNHAS